MKRVILIISGLGLAGFLAWSFVFHGGGTASFSFGDAASRTANDIVSGVSDLLETSRVAVDKTVSAPPPLRNPLTGRGEDLTIEGVLAATNAHRAEAGLPPLKSHASLNAAADSKVADMFAKQYFAHISPSGRGPSDLVDDVGYVYIAVGENLALGTFDDDDDLVQAWMDSPGHRENILGTQFSEIGISVGKGEYEGHTTWLAVQTFARPASDCPAPDADLSAQITGNKSKLAALKQEADTRLADIEATPEPKNRKQSEEYNAKVAKYNEIVRQINELISIIQGQVTVYNGQVQAFNTCAKN